uniref:ATLIG1 n=1 Tax=Arundo donax TaxID=35708 RepID=A0A0A9E491_ARUDO
MPSMSHPSNVKNWVSISHHPHPPDYTRGLSFEPGTCQLLVQQKSLLLGFYHHVLSTNEGILGRYPYLDRLYH